MERLEVGMSPHQCCRLRNGHPVRVKPVMKGSGVILMVAPSTYNSATRSLAKQKGVQIRLNAEEIQANRESAGEMEGRGIFKTIGRVAKKVAKSAGKEIVKGAKKVAPVVKKVAIEGAKRAGREVAKRLPQLATAGLTAAALAAGQPQLVPLAGLAGDKLGTFAGKELNKAIDRPSRYSSFKKARDEIGRSALQEVKDEATSFGKAKIGEAKKYGRERLKKEIDGAKRRRGAGLYAGRGMDGEGLYAGRQGRGVASTPTAGLVGVNGSLLSMSHPAFQSQAHSANFQFQHTLPPQFQMRGNMKGNGLYA